MTDFGSYLFSSAYDDGLYPLPTLGSKSRNNRYQYKSATDGKQHVIRIITSFDATLEIDDGDVKKNQERCFSSIITINIIIVVSIATI